ncbi:MAG: tetratricopeptide repeat protein [Bacteroidota bacterium]|jgi:TolA-binding protein
MNKSIFYIILFTGTAVLISGCFIYDPAANFVKQRYTNAVSYFNTFYNAQRAFSDAESEVLLAQKDFQEKQNASKKFVISQTARLKFNASVEKNSKILTFYPESKWVDDALLMIGKAYSYMGDDVKAERKYVELFAKFPESDLIPEGKLWYGKGLIRQNKITQGVTQLESLFSDQGAADPDIAGSAAYELGEYYLQAKEFAKALPYYRKALQYLSDNDDIARINFQIGSCYNELKQYSEAAAAFSVAGDYAPNYSLVFQSEFRKIKSIAAQGKYDEALENFADMLTDAKNTEYAASIHFEIAATLYLKGDHADAMDKYRFVDTSFARTDESAKSYFKLGQIYEDELLNYDSARVNYNKAKSEFPGSDITRDAILKSNVFDKYNQLSKELVKFDSIYVRALNDLPAYDSLASALRDSISVQTSLMESDLKNRRKAKSVTLIDSVKDSLHIIDSTQYKAALEKVKVQKILIDSTAKSIIRNKFELGGLFFIDLEQPDSALYWYQSIVRETPQSEFAPRALYTIAEIQRAYKNSPKEKLDSLYSLIVKEYPESPYAQEARKILGIPLVQKEVDPAAALYDSAESMIDQKKISNAVSVLKNIASTYTLSPFAAKSLYTAGWCYENEIVDNDSALAVYRRLLIQFPLTQYAVSVRKKIDAYDAEIKRLELEQQKKLEEEKKIEEEKKQKEIEAKAKNEPGTVIPPEQTDSSMVHPKL